MAGMKDKGGDVCFKDVNKEREMREGRFLE
jgi:hypothetical protein